MSDPRADSVRARLLNHARASGEDFNQLLTRYALERWLYRLSMSDQKTRFVLKGALLFSLWFDIPHRPTRDADFLGYGDADVDVLREHVQRICVIPCDDGMRFDPTSIQVNRIRENALHDGLRADLTGWLGTARCKVQLDVGYGDAVTPAAKLEPYPTLLADTPAPQLHVYTQETVIAEKFEALVSLGMRNSRMKDYFDVWVLLHATRLDDATLAQAIVATCQRRRTPLPTDWPTGLTTEFADDPAKCVQWRAFLRNNALDAPTLHNVIAQVRATLARPLDIAKELDA